MKFRQLEVCIWIERLNDCSSIGLTERTKRLDTLNR